MTRRDRRRVWSAAEMTRFVRDALEHNDSEDHDVIVKRGNTFVRGVAVLVLATAAAGFSGCARRDPGPAKVPVSGRVSIDGSPLATGEICFDGRDGRPPVNATVKDGRFSLHAVPGKKWVLVNSYQETGAKDEMGTPIRVSTLPEKFSAASDVTVTVNADGPNDVAIELQSK